MSGWWLDSDGLLSKWGFNDGDVPDGFLDWCDDHGHPYPPDGHDLLRTLVRRYLLPRLEQRVDVVDIGTIHNPIRAQTVDGVDVTGCWYGKRSGPTLTPDGVMVPYEDVLACYAGQEVAA